MTNFSKRLFSTLVLAPAVLYITYLGGGFFLALLLLVYAVGIYEIIFLKNNLIKITIFLIFSLFIVCLYILKTHNSGNYYLIICLIITWLSDSGGYIFGKLIGGKKIKIISPNKTYSGFVGAFFFPCVFLIFFDLENIFKYENFYYILFLSLMSILGDLTFSYFKRKLKIKDYSNLIPGHGGLFDRIDSLIFVVISFYIILIS